MNTRSTLWVAALVAVAGALVVPVTHADEPVTISGTVWQDANANGLRDPGERGAAGVGMGVVKPDGSLADSGYTGADGRYRFDGMPPGTYHVEMLVPQGQTLVRPNAGDDAKDSDLNWVDGVGEMLQCPGGDCGVVDAGLVDRRMDITVSATPNEIRLPSGTRTELEVVVHNTGNVPVPEPRVSGSATSAGPVDEGTGPGWTCGSKGEAHFCDASGLLEPGEVTSQLSFPVVVPEQPAVVSLMSAVDDDTNPADNEVNVTVAPGEGK